MNNNINNQPKSIFEQQNENIVDESFSMDYADTFKKQMFIDNNNLNETVLEQKFKNAQKGNQNQNNNFNFMNQYEDINCIEDDPNITIQNRKKEDYLEVRKFPKYTENEYLNIKKSVGNGLLQIQDFLLVKLKDYNGFDANKKVGPILPLTYLIENHYKFKKENKKQMQEKYDRLISSIYNFRPIYRDGNCFYRCVMFRFIELLIIHKKTEFIKSLIIDMYQSFKSNEIRNRLHIGKDYLNPNLIIQIMITILELIQNNRIEDAHLAFYKAILQSKIFDYSLILYLRYIIYTYIKENEKKLYLESFPVLIENLLPLDYEKNGIFYFKPFYDNNLLKMFTCPEKIIIYLTPFVLGINFKIILFEGKEKEIVKNFDFAGRNDLNIQDSIFLMFRDNRFEIIFNYEENSKYRYIYKYYRNDFKSSFIRVDNFLSNSSTISSENIYNQNIKKSPKSIYVSQIKDFHQKNDYNNNNYKTQIIPNNYNAQYYPNSSIYQNSQIMYNNKTFNLNNGQNMNYGNNLNNKSYYSQYNTNTYNNYTRYNINNCYNNNGISNNNNNCSNNNCNDIDKNNKAFTYYNSQYTYKDDQQQNLDPNNFINNQEEYKCKTSIYFYNNEVNYKNNSILFDKSQNIYSIAQKFNNMNINENNINNNMNYNNNINNINKENNSELHCSKCSSLHSGLKNINSICPNCFRAEIINQARYFYINYLKKVTKLEKVNSITKKDFENLFLNQIVINFDNKAYNIYQAIDEFNCQKNNIKFDFNHILKDILLAIKQQICLYCYGPVQNSEFKFPCGCNFCSYYHLNLFMNEKVQTNITYNYICFCSFKYKPNKVFQMCNLLFNKQIYKNYDIFIECLNAIFCKICFKCGAEKKELLLTNIDGIGPNQFKHYICNDCAKNDNSNCSECVICKIKHKYMINNF